MSALSNMDSYHAAHPALPQTFSELLVQVYSPRETLLTIRDLNVAHALDKLVDGFIERHSAINQWDIQVVHKPANSYESQAVDDQP